MPSPSSAPASYTSTTSAEPATDSATAPYSDGFRRRPYATRSHSSTSSGPVNWITSATLIGSRSMARKYVSCTSASPAMPSHAICATSARAIRSRDRSTSTSAPASSANDSVTRS